MAIDTLTEVERLTGITDRRLTSEEVNYLLNFAFGNASINRENELLLQSRKAIPRETIIEELGEGVAEPFEYLDSLLFSGKRTERVQAGVQKRRHAYDSAYHAARFGFKGLDKEVIMLHDVLEYTSKTLPEAHERAEQIRGKFGDYVADNVLAVSDFAAIIINEISRRIQKNGVGTGTRVFDLKKYLGWIRSESATRRHEAEFKGLEEAIAKLGQGKMNLRYDADVSYNVYADIEKMTVPLFVEGIFRTARERVENGAEDYYVPLVARAASYIDRIRTMGADALSTIEEAELFIDKLSGFNKVLSNSSVVNIGIQVMDAALKNQILGQASIIAAGYSGRDSAFLTEQGKLRDKVLALQRKYH